MSKLKDAFIMLIQNRHAIFIDDMGCVYEMEIGYMRWISKNKINIKISTKNLLSTFM